MTQRNVVCKTTLVWIALAALLLSPTRAGAARLVASLPAGRFFLTPQSAQEKEQERRERAARGQHRLLARQEAREEADPDRVAGAERDKGVHE